VPGSEPGTPGSVAKNSDHYGCEGVTVTVGEHGLVVFRNRALEKRICGHAWLEMANVGRTAHSVDSDFTFSTVF
jgi:hypothetical protein